ncbi:hypothetical protein [Cohnella sp.]|uniref:hypothetical protein n=1 Tax=Cohnella sp. TaxID=1883426 RepID=UPI003561CD0C
MRIITIQMILAIIIVTGCSTKQDIPLEMKVSKIEVYSLSVNQEKERLSTITDNERIQAIITELNKLNKTDFAHSESPGDLYEIHFISEEKEKVYLYHNVVGIEGKIYTRSSAKNDLVWKVSNKLSEYLLRVNR